MSISAISGSVIPGFSGSSGASDTALASLLRQLQANESAAAAKGSDVAVSGLKPTAIVRAVQPAAAANPSAADNASSPGLTSLITSLQGFLVGLQSTSTAEATTTPVTDVSAGADATSSPSTTQLVAANEPPVSPSLQQPTLSTPLTVSTAATTPPTQATDRSFIPPDRLQTDALDTRSQSATQFAGNILSAIKSYATQIGSFALQGRALSLNA